MTGDPRRWRQRAGHPGRREVLGAVPLPLGRSTPPTTPRSARGRSQHLADVIMVEGAATRRRHHARDRRRHERHPRAARRLPAGRARALRRARHRDDRRRGDGRLRPLRRVVRRRPLGRDARPDRLRQGRQLGLRAARRRDHQPAPSPTRSPTRPYPGGLTYSGHPLACASAVASINIFKEEGIIEHARHLGDDVVGPGTGRDGRRATRRSARCAASACSGRSSWCATSRRASRSCRTTPPAPTPRRWPSWPRRASSAACGRSPTSTGMHVVPPLTISDDDMRDGPGGHRRGARRWPTATPLVDSTGMRRLFRHGRSEAARHDRVARRLASDPRSPIGPVAPARRRRAHAPRRAGRRAAAHEALGGGPRLRADRRGADGDRRPRRTAGPRASTRLVRRRSARSSCAPGSMTRAAPKRRAGDRAWSTASRAPSTARRTTATVR